MIWEYADQYIPTEDEVDRLIFVEDCPYCGERLRLLSERRGGTMFYAYKDSVRFCPCCGWWILEQFGEGWCHVPMQVEIHGAVPSLKQFSLNNPSVEVEEVKRYLLARYDQRFEVHPRIFEEVVGSVFRSTGYDVVVTGFANDGGIDAILHAPDGSTVGIQVKRYRGTVEIEPIRALVGALVQHGTTQGIFVTTSSFSRGANHYKDAVHDRGYRIELLNAQQFFEALRLSSRSAYEYRDDETAPFNSPDVALRRWLIDY